MRQFRESPIAYPYIEVTADKMGHVIAEHGWGGVFGSWGDWGDAIALCVERSSGKFPSFPEVEKGNAPPKDTPTPHNVVATLKEVANSTPNPIALGILLRYIAQTSKKRTHNQKKPRPSKPWKYARFPLPSV